MPGKGPIRGMRVVGDLFFRIGPFPGISPHYNNSYRGFEELAGSGRVFGQVSG